MCCLTNHKDPIINSFALCRYSSPLQYKNLPTQQGSSGMLLSQTISFTSLISHRIIKTNQLDPFVGTKGHHILLIPHLVLLPSLCSLYCKWNSYVDIMKHGMLSPLLILLGLRVTSSCQSYPSTIKYSDIY